MPHPQFTMMTAVMLSAALALIGKRPLGERLAAATYLLLCCGVSAVAGSWLMHWIHG